MPARPPHDPGSAAPESGATELPGRSLSEILEELAQISHAQQGEASAMRGAVSELSRSLARLFEMIRADRASQHTRIAELEEALAKAEATIRELESGETAGAGDAAPSANDFDALRGAAERLRLRTAQLVREAGTPADELARDEADAAHQAEIEAAHEIEAHLAEEARVEAARLAVEASLAEDEALAARRAADEAAAARTELPATPVADEPFGRPGILRVFPGAVLPATIPPDLDVESDLIGFDGREVRQAVAHAAAPTISPADHGDPPAGTGRDTTDAAAHVDRTAESSVTGDARASEAGAHGAADPDGIGDPDEPSAPTLAPPTIPKPVVVERTPPVPVAPRVARKRKGRLRRRRIDARKLATVDPSSALRAMVSSIDTLWTAGNSVDLVVALTDGGTMHVYGGDREPLTVADVKPGTSARATVTVASAQVVPLFGRLDLTDEQSAPLIHGSRRDADLLVGWIDRAQRLESQPL